MKMNFTCKRITVLMIIGLIAFPLWSQQLDSLKISNEYNNQTLEQIFDQLSADYKIDFYYDDSWFPKDQFSFQFDETPFPKALLDILENKGLSFAFYNDYAVIIARETELEKEYTREYFVFKELQAEENNEVSANREEIIPVGKPDNISPTGKAKISGYVEDKNSGDFLIGATVFAMEEGIGTATNETGGFELVLPIGVHTLEVKSISYKDRQVKIQLFSNGDLQLELLEAPVRLDEVTVFSESPDQNVNSTTLGIEKLDIKELKKLPSFLGEVDVMKSMTLLAGVASVGEGSSGFNVRGGNVDQNLVMQEGAIIFNSSHILGLFSLFNPDLVKNVTLYKGMIPAKYGGRLSSVLDVELKEANFHRFSGKGGVGLIASRLSFEAPIKKEKTSLIVGARSSYSNWVFNSVDLDRLDDSRAFYFDLNAKVTHLLKNNGKISVSWYQSNDRFQLTSSTNYEWSTKIANLKWRKPLGDALTTSLSLSWSKYASTLKNISGNKSTNFDQSSSYVKVANDYLWTPGGGQSINFGAELIYYDMFPGQRTPGDAQSLVETKIQPHEKAYEAAFYIQDDIELSPNLAISIGLRASGFAGLGPADVFVYEPGLPRSVGSIIDTFSYAPGELGKTFGGLEPRASVKLNLSPNTSIKAGYSRTFQYVNQISNTATITPVDIWQISNDNIPPQKGHNFSVGLFGNFNENRLEASAEVYYKLIDDLLEFKDLPQLLVNDHIETELLTGIGRNYGLELTLRKKTGVFRGWFSYTYSRSRRKVDGNFPEETINVGFWYNSNYDKPHDLTLTPVLQLNKRNILSFNFTYSTGRPTTAPVTKFRVDNVPSIPVYSLRNQFRIPDYHRLDISYTIESSHRINQAWKSSWTFSIYNVYSRQNAYSVFFEQDGFSEVRAFKLSILGSAFPTITYNFKF